MVERFWSSAEGKLRTENWGQAGRISFFILSTPEAAARRSALFDYALFDGEAEEFGIVGEAEVLHDAVFVKGDGAGGYVQDGGGFFHGVAFGEELQDFALARRQNSARLRATWLAGR